MLGGRHLHSNKIKQIWSYKLFSEPNALSVSKFLKLNLKVPNMNLVPKGGKILQNNMLQRDETPQSIIKEKTTQFHHCVLFRKKVFDLQ